MKEDQKQQKQEEKKPDEELFGHAAAHLVIRDKNSGKEIINQRG
jgi:hypothetical protein